MKLILITTMLLALANFWCMWAQFDELSSIENSKPRNFSAPTVCLFALIYLMNVITMVVWVVWASQVIKG